MKSGELSKGRTATAPVADSQPAPPHTQGSCNLIANICLCKTWSAGVSTAMWFSHSRGSGIVAEGLQSGLRRSRQNVLARSHLLMNTDEAWQNNLEPVGQSMSSKVAGGSSSYRGKTPTKLDSSASFEECFFPYNFLNIQKKRQS